MDDTIQGELQELATGVERWTQPLDETACGPNLEYDPAFLELGIAAAGKPETQFAPAEPPQWPAVLAQAAELMDRTRDLRVAVPWLRAAVAMHGVYALPLGLRLMQGWLETLWDGLHPELDPDDGDPFARLNVLGELATTEGLLGELRLSRLYPDRRLGGLRVRDVEVALERLPAREDDPNMSLGQIEGMLADVEPAVPALTEACQGALDAVQALEQLLIGRVGSERATDLAPLRQMLQAVTEVLGGAGGGAEPGADAEFGADDGGFGGGDSDSDAPAPARRGRGPGSIDTRADAVRAIQQICAFLERTEPSNPAQFFLRRAEQLIEKNFLQLIKELAPGAMDEVARMVGVDPEQVQFDE